MCLSFFFFINLKFMKWQNVEYVEKSLSYAKIWNLKRDSRSGMLSYVWQYCNIWKNVLQMELKKE